MRHFPIAILLFLNAACSTKETEEHSNSHVPTPSLPIRKSTDVDAKGLSSRESHIGQESTPPPEYTRIMHSEEYGYSVYVSGGGEQKRNHKFKNVPHSVFALSNAPERREDKLNEGDWVVLVYHVSSIRGTQSIGDAIEAAILLGDRVHVGIRSFMLHEEIVTWTSAEINATDMTSPVWVFFSSGKIKSVLRGRRTAKDIVEMVDTIRAARKLR